MQQQIIIPVVLMMLLTFAVWLTMFAKRISAMKAKRVSAEKLKHRKDKVILGDDVNAPSECFQNLLELPILFYAISLLLYVTDKVDTIYIALAYIFVAFRVFQAIIHCSYNTVMHRFLTYIAASTALFAIIIRFAIGLVG